VSGDSLLQIGESETASEERAGQGGGDATSNAGRSREEGSKHGDNPGCGHCSSGSEGARRKSPLEKYGDFREVSGKGSRSGILRFLHSTAGQ